MHPGCAACIVTAADGTLVDLLAFEYYVGPRFEVFPLKAEITTGKGTIDQYAVDLAAPVAITFQETEEWLDPTVPCGKTIGNDPIMQCQGPPGSASESAVAACRHIGGVELRGSNGSALFIATATFPHSLHVQGYAEDERFNRDAYVPAAQLCVQAGR